MRLSFSRAIAAAAVVATAVYVPTASAALPASASPAPLADYAQFHTLAKPLRVLDLLKASQHDLARTAAPLKDLPPKWHTVYDAALAPGIEANREILTDTIMRAAFGSFSHEEVQRLSVIASSPVIERLQTAKINALNSDSPNIDGVRQWWNRMRI